MANPIISAVTSIQGGTSAVNPAGTSATLVVDNPVDSGTVVKINTLRLTNKSTTTTRTVTVTYYSGENLGGTGTVVGYASLAAGSSTVVASIAERYPVYLNEDTSLGITASSGGNIVAIASYEVLS